MSTRHTVAIACFLLMSSFQSPEAAANSGPSTSNATGLTRTLYTNLHNLNEFQLLFGHQNTSVQGIKPQFTDLVGTSGNSDALSGVGDYPAIYGFDFSDVNFPGIGFDQFKQHVINAYTSGGIVTFSFHARNPVTGGSYSDLSGNPVADILQNGQAWQTYKGWLDEIAVFANTLTVNNKKVPIIFRPLHEGNGDWFWWGSSNASSSQYKSLWYKTVDYLRSKGVNNFLYAYSPSGGVDSGRYPSTGYVDIIAPTVYGINDFSATIRSVARSAVNLAEQGDKIAALGEVGPTSGFGYSTARNDFYSNILLNTIKSDSVANRISFALVWRNASFSHYWLPVQGTHGFSSFSTFYSDKVAMFDSNLPAMYKPATTATNGFAYCTTADADKAGYGWGFEYGRSCVVIGGAQDPHAGRTAWGYPYCTLGAVDPDGDGWGWQNGATCVVPGSQVDPLVG